LTEEQQSRVERAAAFCADVVVDGWADAVATRAADCLSLTVWNSLFKGRRRRDCKALAALAKALLAGKKKLHEMVGAIGGWLAGLIGGNLLARAAAKELAEKIPIPVIDERTMAVARGLQVIGISLCLAENTPLDRCQCFIDLALAETKERVKQVLATALDDWTARAWR
jgi:tetrahydromethanopterin S-methyltransferase subunit C